MLQKSRLPSMTSTVNSRTPRTCSRNGRVAPPAVDQPTPEQPRRIQPASTRTRSTIVRETGLAPFRSAQKIFLRVPRLMGCVGPQKGVGFPPIATVPLRPGTCTLALLLTLRLTAPLVGGQAISLHFSRTEPLPHLKLPSDIPARHPRLAIVLVAHSSL